MLRIDASAPPLRFAAVFMSDLRVSEEPTAFDELMKCAEGYAERYAWTPPSEIPGVQQARRLFRAVGIDPTKRRPSSEALLHRALKRKGLGAVNTLVDVGNWCSLEFLLPTCIYDLRSISGEIVLRLGRAGESYAALNGRDMDFEGRLVLADDLGPFGSPMTDSLRTAVSPVTTAALLGIWAPEDHPHERLQQQAQLFAERAQRFCGGTVDAVMILPEDSEK